MPMSSAILSARFQEALTLHQQGRLALAQTLYEQVLEVQPRHFDALHLLGVIAAQLADPEKAAILISRALECDPNNAGAYFNRGTAFQALGQLDTALSDYDQAVALKPDFAEAYSNRGMVLQALSRLELALDSYDRAVAIKPDFAQAHLNRGNVLQLTGAHEQAVDSYERALSLQPNLVAALNNQGHSLRIMRRTDRALQVLAHALELQPGYAMALNNRGLVFFDLRRIHEALRCFDAALAAAPTFREALSNRGTALLELKRYADAGRDFERLARDAPNFGGALGNLLWARRNCCDWTDYESNTARVVAAVQRGAYVDAPLSFLCTSDSPQAQLTCARTFTLARYPPQPLPITGPRTAHDRIRVAYVSGDFGAHAVSYMLTGVLEHHDRDRFETIAVAWGRHDDGAIRQRLERAFGRFIDATARSDREIATLLRDLEIDIAIDLTGHTGGQRTDIFAHRCAPIQVNYLGYPGTSGASYMDYLIADAIVVPAGEEDAYSEHVVRLPHCYMPTDNRRATESMTPTRAAAGLPATGFVFCAFNNPVKITPQVFSIWLGLLREVPAAVLWLRADAPEVRANLLHAARTQDVDPTRLVFAPAVKAMESHLARYRLADLFLDTLPYNAHATACDALWAGLPVLTCRGGSFAGRVGASLLAALGVPELVTDSLTSYAQTALELARDSQRLAAIRARMDHLRHGSPVFNTTRYCRHLESAYATMWARCRDGLPPTGFMLGALESMG